MRVIVFDLDDTLCKEIDYLKSAYRAIASYAVNMCADCGLPVQVLEARAYEAMMDAYKSGRNAFEALNIYLGLELLIGDLLQMYREHVPDISLEEDVRSTLNRLKAEGVLMGIVSDGRELTQWNKIRALGLTEWIDENFIIINTTQECFKPNSCGYEKLMEAVRTQNSEANISFTYVGDNLKKDFVWPKSNGWETVCLKNDGRNIHAQDFEHTPSYAFPVRIVNSIREI